MKRLFTLLTMVLMIGLLAGVTYAQDAEREEPTVNMQYDGNGGIHRNGLENMDPTSDPDADGAYTHGDPFGEGPQLQPGTGVSDADKENVESPGKKERKLEWVNAAPEANGGIHRRGAEFVGEGGPHSAGVDDQDKLFIDEDGDGICDNDGEAVMNKYQYRGANATAAMSGTMSGSAFGAGDGQITEGQGPLDGAAAFGPGQDNASGTPAAGDPSQAQSGSGNKK